MSEIVTQSCQFDEFDVVRSDLELRLRVAQMSQHLLSEMSDACRQTERATAETQTAGIESAKGPPQSLSCLSC